MTPIHLPPSQDIIPLNVRGGVNLTGWGIRGAKLYDGPAPLWLAVLGTWIARILIGVVLLAAVGGLVRCALH